MEYLCPSKVLNDEKGTFKFDKKHPHIALTLELLHIEIEVCIKCLSQEC